ncbi:phosphatidate cytidylyltransferase, mitochondrial-like isoform X2 [Hibiscus syriacus]|uniref:phosphatidate cytidylyltransferase, mitochondrial-like isoform X2 n=1 Tax=Hibiscus syriacus TaxID=106335 RepID=UPI0019249B20|nr:phosphatidate cytidylyltransferase, mitochondrial-like isoform X2 [Hibiscus syriacus]
MVDKDAVHAHLLDFLKAIPPVEFCCVYGSALHSTNPDKSTMTDYMLGVSDPLQWHSEITGVADNIGVGVHFNPYVTWNNKMLKYGVVRMNDLIQDILNWESLYLSGRLQKPVNMLVDKLDIENVNSVNLRAAVSAALLLLPPKFTEEDLYAKICSLSYMGDLRMLFAEDRNKVKKIVRGQFDLFRTMYKTFLLEYEDKDFLRFSSSTNQLANISQDCGLAVTCSHVSSLPPSIRSRMGIKKEKMEVISKSGEVDNRLGFGSRKEAAQCMQKVLRRTVRVSSARQAISGVLTVGGVTAARYLSNKMCKAWRSWTLK